MRLFPAMLGALVITLSSVASASGEQQQNPFNDQGSSPDYRSLITSVSPSVPGLHLEVLQFSDRLQMTNHTHRTVTVRGYEGEPYARIQPDGTVEVNTHSPAYYLNQSFYANVTVPPSATPHAQPRWTVIDRTGQLEWHDHRIHWMSPIPPQKVTDKSKRTFIFNWKVPIEVGSRPGTIDGQLFWVPESSKAPTGAIAGLVAFTLLASALVVFLRRRRSRRPPGAAGSTAEGPRAGGRPPGPDVEERLKEAW